MLFLIVIDFVVVRLLVAVVLAGAVPAFPLP
jgi:hypothetical protein